MDEQKQIVTCPCQYCSGKIEFDASDFTEGEPRTVECPHCKLESLIFVPISPNPSPVLPKLPAMPQPPTTPNEPKHFVYIPCRHCGKPMEFMAEFFAKYVNRSASCPSCQELTTIRLDFEEQDCLNRQAISSNVRREVWRRDQGKCVKCGSRVNLEYDHIIPVSMGGSNTARNIELLCEACNRTKSNLIQ